jgi:hypothetical protein
VSETETENWSAAETAAGAEAAAAGAGAGDFCLRRRANETGCEEESWYSNDIQARETKEEEA